MMRLPYTKGWVYNFESKRYSVQEVEKTAWEKYGGPSGLKAAQEAYVYFICLFLFFFARLNDVVPIVESVLKTRGKPSVIFAMSWSCFTHL
jgi:hypothetical protein